MKTLGLLALMLIAACNRAPSVLELPKREPASMPMKDLWSALRVKHDTVRDRLWVLRLEHVEVYDRRTQSLIRRIELAPWTVARLVCPPDITFDRTGTAYISHNVEPRLWQIDADSFQLKEYPLRLLQKEHLDIGLTTLRFAPDGTLFAVASLGGSRWRIDLDNTSAQLVDVEAPAMDECALQ